MILYCWKAIDPENNSHKRPQIFDSLLFLQGNDGFMTKQLVVNLHSIDVGTWQICRKTGSKFNKFAYKRVITHSDSGLLSTDAGVKGLNTTSSCHLSLSTIINSKTCECSLHPSSCKSCVLPLVSSFIGRREVPVLIMEFLSEYVLRDRCNIMRVLSDRFPLRIIE